MRSQRRPLLATQAHVSRSAGSACIAERRVTEKIDLGEIRTGSMRYGGRVCMQALFGDGSERGPGGVIDQRVVAAANGRRGFAARGIPERA